MPRDHKTALVFRQSTSCRQTVPQMSRFQRAGPRPSLPADLPIDANHLGRGCPRSRVRQSRPDLENSRYTGLSTFILNSAEIMQGR